MPGEAGQERRPVMTKIATIIACVAGLSVTVRNVAELIKLVRDWNRTEDD